MKYFWLASFLYIAIYLNGQIVSLKNELIKTKSNLETMTYQFGVCKKLYKKTLTCTQKPAILNKKGD